MTDRTVHLVGFSGGIDSQACARWVLNRQPDRDVVLINTQAGRNEHPMTVEFVEWYSANVHPVTEIVPKIKDLAGRCKGKIAELGLDPDDELTFDLLAELKGRFPSTKVRFCTTHLKLEPQKRWIAENLADCEVIRYSGVRRDESRARKDTCIEAWDDYFECGLRCPIADWTKQMCFDYVQAHGERINELYTLGFNRVGCAPCINSNKADVRAWAERFPEMIDKVRAWEQRVGRTFFPPIVPGQELNWVDEVVEWSKTVRGGRQYALDVLVDRPTCESIYGLCE